MSSTFLRFGAAAALAVSLLALAGCGATGAIQTGTELSIGEYQGLDSLNPDVSENGKSASANADLGELTTVGFYSRDAAGDLVANTSFGTVKLASKLPFTITYSLTGAATWSDGTKVDATDLLLSWLAASGSEKFGFHSLRADSGLRFATAIPKLSTDLNRLTVQYSRPVTDWRTSIYPAVPAHLVTQRAFAATNLDARAAKSRFVQDVNTSNEADLTEIARQYVAAFSLTGGAKVNTKNLVGAGPYLVASADAVAGVKLTANPAFSWGNQPRIETVNVRYYEDSLAMIADIQIGKLDLAAPLESGAAKVEEIRGLAKKADLNFGVGLSQNIDAVRLNLGEGSVFNDATAGADRAEALRQAFLLSVPTGQIAQAVNSDYAVQRARSFFFAPDQVGYSTTTKKNGSDKFAFQNLETASELLAKVGITARSSIDIRVVFDSTNPRHQLVWGELNKLSKQFGFNLVNAATGDLAGHLATGDYDVAIQEQSLFSADQFAPAAAVPTSIFESKTYANALKQLATTRKASLQQNLAAELDAALFAAGYGLPLYQTPTMVVYSKNVGGASLSPLGNSAVWGYWNWQKASK